MPSTVDNLFSAAGISTYKKVKWGKSFNADGTGVYIISLSPNPLSNDNLLSHAPISDSMIEFWINKVETLQLDKKNHPEVRDIKNRLNEFWLPDENILYIGMTGSKLSNRVKQYYNTELGERRPHAGGHWLKTLYNLSDLYVYYSECDLSLDVENYLIKNFIDNVSDKTKEKLRDPKHPFPFANLEYPRGTRKDHGISKAKLKN